MTQKTMRNAGSSEMDGLDEHKYEVLFVQTPVVQKVDNAIHRINHYPLDIAIGFAITYPVDSDLSGG